VLLRGYLLLLVLVGKELAVLLVGVLLQFSGLVGNRPMLPVLPVIMGKGLQLMLLLLLLLLVIGELRLLGLARARLLFMVLMGTNMRLVAGPLVVLV
jgi:hypothetical protein